MTAGQVLRFFLTAWNRDRRNWQRAVAKLKGKKVRPKNKRKKLKK